MKDEFNIRLEVVDATPMLAQALGDLINKAMRWRNAGLDEKILCEADLAVAVDDLVRVLSDIDSDEPEAELN